MIGWSVELSEYWIKYEPRGPIKAQVLADFITEMENEPMVDHPSWVLYVDGSSNAKGVRAGVVLEGPGDLLVEQSLRFGFKTSNNQAEYEALIAGLELTHDMRASDIICRSDSQMTVGHIIKEFQVKDSILLKYYHKVHALLGGFSSARLEHIKREHNARVDLLSKLASTKKGSHHRSIVQQHVEVPSVSI